MSFQLQPTTPAQGPRRGGLLGLGVVLLIAGVGAGVALFLASGSQYDDAVKSLQRAPVGCDTEFDFTGTGTFIFYAETKGEIGDLRGDCDNAGTDYEFDGEPDVDLVLSDEDGEEVDLDRGDGASYDAAGFTGSQVASFELDEPGTYTLSVISDDDDFAIAVGRNPKDDADGLKTIAIIVLAAGVVLGALFIILGLRRKPVAPTGGAWNPAGTPPAATFGGYQPTGGPPIASPPTAPPTAPPQPSWQPTPPPSSPGAPPPPPGQPGSPWGTPQ